MSDDASFEIRTNEEGKAQMKKGVQKGGKRACEEGGERMRRRVDNTMSKKR